MPFTALPQASSTKVCAASYASSSSHKTEELLYTASLKQPVSACLPALKVIWFYG